MKSEAMNDVHFGPSDCEKRQYFCIEVRRSGITHFLNHPVSNYKWSWPSWRSCLVIDHGGVAVTPSILFATQSPSECWYALFRVFFPHFTWDMCARKVSRRWIVYFVTLPVTSSKSNFRMHTLALHVTDDRYKQSDLWLLTSSRVRMASSWFCFGSISSESIVDEVCVQRWRCVVWTWNSYEREAGVLVLREAGGKEAKAEEDHYGGFNRSEFLNWTSKGGWVEELFIIIIKREAPFFTYFQLLCQVKLEMRWQLTNTQPQICKEQTKRGIILSE